MRKQLDRELIEDTTPVKSSEEKSIQTYSKMTLHVRVRYEVLFLCTGDKVKLAS